MEIWCYHNRSEQAKKRKRNDFSCIFIFKMLSSPSRKTGCQSCRVPHVHSQLSFTHEFIEHIPILIYRKRFKHVIFNRPLVSRLATLLSGVRSHRVPKARHSHGSLFGQGNLSLSKVSVFQLRTAALKYLAFSKTGWRAKILTCIGKSTHVQQGKTLRNKLRPMPIAYVRPVHARYRLSK